MKMMVIVVKMMMMTTKAHVKVSAIEIALLRYTWPAVDDLMKFDI